MRGFGLTLALLATCLTASEAFAGRKYTSDPIEVANEIDRLLAEGFRQKGITPAPITTDENFLTRAAFDLTGGPPSPEEVLLFSFTPGTSKRAELIDRLLNTEGYALNWARYWRDVIFSRATNQRAVLAKGSFETWLTERIQDGAHWDDITTELLTANGEIRENGATALLFAHDGDANEIAGEVSRIFMGIQIQCANCHKHPYDDWTRDDFHQLAAYFPRVRVRQQRTDNNRFEFYVEGNDRYRDPQQLRNNLPQMFRFLDRNRDNKLTEAEVKGTRAARIFERIIDRADQDYDGALSMKEIEDLPEPMMDRNRDIEHYMPDLSKPDEKGRLMQPALFTAKSMRIRAESTDEIRRRAAATGITSKSNIWFARAYVNRMWGELVGEGFYNPIDDLGPKREAQFAEALDLLVSGFIASDYDMKWVFRAIMNTEAYQRAVSNSVDDPVNGNAFAAAAASRMRADQIYSALVSFLGQPNSRTMGRAGRMGGGRLGMSDPARFLFTQLFEFDPSTPKEDRMGDIPQALFMMNSPMLNAGLAANGFTALGRLLNEHRDDEKAVSELYLKILSREPTKKELNICLDYIDDVGNRSEAFEDLTWSLLNSAEFTSRR
ncbi:DUF1549 domain-containing protein [Calycomorphotria hydatis]|uniref:EF-hand domain-containing protein n=1 Tax=Calycomorphotria hydatis TaxID=2528027 RepID=A0A517T7L2_9PLAN|nr:DUF1549 domain-containing protein [Calycomorphotria hydatis]QDT64368.1 hypothetical protein V22_16020 [Calycomorphotria hydatis]